MPPDERRKALIDATIPLLLEHGLGVTTRQVADAAGVAEGTIFRAFGSKDDLLHAAVTDALSNDGLDAALATIDPDAGLQETVSAIIGAVSERVTRMRALVGLFHGAGYHHGAVPEAAAEPGASGEGPLRCARPDPRTAHARITASVEAALGPHADALRTSPARAASALLSFTFGVLHPVAGDPALTDPDAVADLLLHGLSKEA